MSSILDYAKEEGVTLEQLAFLFAAHNTFTSLDSYINHNSNYLPSSATLSNNWKSAWDSINNNTCAVIDTIQQYVQIDTNLPKEPIVFIDLNDQCSLNELIKNNQTHKVDNCTSEVQPKEVKKDEAEYTLLDMYKIVKFFTSSSIIAASYSINPQLAVFAGLTIVVSFAGEYTAEFEGLIGRVGQFFHDNTIKLFAVASTCLISSKIMSDWGIDDPQNHKFKFAMAKILASVVMPVISSSVSNVQSQLDELLKKYLYSSEDSQSSKEEKAEASVRNEKVKEECESKSKDDFKGYFTTLKQKTKDDIIYQTLFTTKNGVGRFTKEVLKHLTDSSLTSESGANIIKSILFDDKNSSDIESHGIILTNAAAKILAKATIRQISETDYIVAVVGTIASNVANEMLSQSKGDDYT